MKGLSLLFIAVLCCIAAQAAPHGHEHDDADTVEVSSSDQTGSLEAVPSNGTPANANPTIAYIPAKEENSHAMDTDMDMDMGMGDMGGMEHSNHHNHSIVEGPIPPEMMSYWLWPEHRGLLYAHIIIMTISWGFVLPVGTCKLN
jgi:Domain of unknown function (DUF2427)